MPGPDAYYTPAGLASRLLSYAIDHPRTAIDFCVGDGGLLTAAEEKFPGITCYGVDISDEVIANLKERQPLWSLAHCDFKDGKALAKIPFLKGRKFDLIVLNPPFTCRGSSINKVFIGDEEYHVSTAMSFLVGALPYLSDNGSIYAILPITCVYSEKDRKCWQYLEENYNACVLTEVHKASFKGKCTPNIVLVYLGRVPYPATDARQILGVGDFGFSLKGIKRGRLCVYQMKKVEAGNDRLPYIHTTNMRGGELVDVVYTRRDLKESVEGYGLLIPRVCNPNEEKLVVLDKIECILSDCVVLLQTWNRQQAERLRQYLIEHWMEFTNNYVGTGARYVTMERLRQYFNCEE